MEKLKVGLIGLGRIGMQYAHYLSLHAKNVDLIAACSTSQEELTMARTKYGIPGIFTDIHDFMANPEIEAVFVLSSTDQHADHMIQCLRHGKHVFSEKPLAITLENCLRVKKEADARPDLTATVGFVRRFDASYRHAKQKIEEGAIGRICRVHSQTVDKDTIAAFQIKNMKSSGGIFHDMNVHDIDLVRWLTGSEIRNVYALGGAFKYPEFAEIGDADQVFTTCTMADGSIATIGSSRIAAHGHDTYTEINGTLGTLIIGRPAPRYNVEILDGHGVRRESVQTFWERFEDAFYRQIDDFVQCVLERRPTATTLDDAIEATRAAIAFSTSFAENKVISLP